MWTSQQPALLERLASSALDIRFIEIAHITVDEGELEDLNMVTRVSKFVLKAKPHIEDALRSLLSSSPISAFVTDTFCTDLLDVGAKLNLPTYLFISFSASVLCFMMHLPTLVSNIEVSFKDADFEVEVPGLSPIPARDLPSHIQDRSNSAFKWFVHHSTRLKEASGFLINTFAELEEEAIKALCTPATPPMYPIGPLLQLTESDTPQDSTCLKWLDEQPAVKIRMSREKYNNRNRINQ
ncbi:hypothetical protein SUGI_1000460 [Cryptomeria japonica]|nr:hypothetical protein SUGI_1000460 [Cryptomeria japonica]